MQPIINPLYIYLIDTSNGIKLASVVVAVLSFLFTCLYLIDYEELNKVSLSIFIISTLLALLIPTGDTIIKMILANQITIDRVDMSKQIIETVYKDIINMLNK